MRPFIALLGIVSGSLVSLAFGLLVVVMVFWLLRNDHPRFASELPAVARSAAIFLCLATAAAVAFVGTLKQRRWRYGALSLLWAGLLLAGFYYWPS